MKYLLLILSLAISLSAEPLKLTNKQADELLGALLRVPSGLSATNTLKSARNINALRADNEAYTKALTAASANHLTPDTKVGSPQEKAYTNEVLKLQDEIRTYDLQRFALTDEEMDKAKPSPAVLSTLLLYLEPKVK